MVIEIALKYQPMRSNFVANHIAATRAVSHEIAVTTFPTLPATAPISCGLTRRQASTTCAMMALLAIGADKYENFLD